MTRPLPDPITDMGTTIRLLGDLDTTCARCNLGLYAHEGEIADGHRYTARGVVTLRAVIQLRTGVPPEQVLSQLVAHSRP